ncbi:MAG: YraN family protein [Eggerthellaceae bacterium]|jgi:putative endonuclease
MNTYGLSRPIAATADVAGAASIERTGRCLDILATMATAERAGASAARAKRRTVAKAKRAAKPAAARESADAAVVDVPKGTEAAQNAADGKAQKGGMRSDAPSFACGETAAASPTDFDEKPKAQRRDVGEEPSGAMAEAHDAISPSGPICADGEEPSDEALPTASDAGRGGTDATPPVCADAEDEGGGQSAGGEREHVCVVDDSAAEAPAAPCGNDDGQNQSPESATPGAADAPEERPPLSALSNKQIGQRGEDAAVRFLKNKGYRILDRNWTCPAGEADVVAMDCEVLVFIEVKTRTSIDAGMPEEAVTPEKRARYERIAAYYLRDFRSVEMPIRFDVIGILVVADDRAILKHHINAFAVA